MCVYIYYKIINMHICRGGNKLGRARLCLNSTSLSKNLKA